MSCGNCVEMEDFLKLRESTQDEIKELREKLTALDKLVHVLELRTRELWVLENAK